MRGKLHLVDLVEHKDASALYLADRGRFKERFLQALERATPWTERQRELAEDAAQEAWAKCGELAQEPDLLGRFADDLLRCGVVGEAKAAKLLYLVVTSRVLERPVSMALKGPSSGGKSFLVERVLRFLPESAY